MTIGTAMACGACLPIFEAPATPYFAPASLPYQPSVPVVPEPAPYQPPPISSVLPSQPMPPLVGMSPAAPPQVRYVPPSPFASTSLLTPPPAFATASSGSLLGPQRSDWKPGGGF